MATPPAPSLSPAPSVSVAPSLSLPPALGANCSHVPRDTVVDIAAESSVILGKGININAENNLYAVFAGNGGMNCNRDTVDTFVTINGTVAESKYGVALLASDRTAVTMCDGHFQGGINRYQSGVTGFDMGGPGYLQMACGSILAGNSYSDYVPSPALILQDTLFKSNITGGNIIGGCWPGDHDENEYWENRGPSMYIGARKWINGIFGPTIYALSVHLNIFGGNFEGGWDLYPKSVINVYGYDLELSDDNEMPCPPYNWLPDQEVDTTTCKVLTGYLCDDAPINVKIRFISREASNSYVDFDEKGEVNRFNNVNCKKAVPKIDGCGMQKCKKSAKSGKQDIFD